MHDAAASRRDWHRVSCYVLQYTAALQRAGSRLPQVLPLLPVVRLTAASDRCRGVRNGEARVLPPMAAVIYSN